jgi:hypothetical protein
MGVLKSERTLFMPPRSTYICTKLNSRTNNPKVGENNGWSLVVFDLSNAVLTAPTKERIDLSVHSKLLVTNISQ